MKRLIRLFTLALVVAVPALAHSTSKARTISGRVTDARGWAGNTQFSVVVAGTRIGVVTNDSGYFTLADVPDTPVVLVVKHPCYFTTRVEIPENATSPLALGMPFDEASRTRAGCGGLGARSDGRISSLSDDAHVASTQKASSAEVFQTVLLTHGLENLRSYAFDPMPVCPSRPRRPECSRHDGAAIAKVQGLAPGGSAKSGWHFSLTPVRDSGAIRIVGLYLMVDSIEPGYGEVEYFRFVLDGMGRRIIEGRQVSSDMVVRSR